MGAKKSNTADLEPAPLAPPAETKCVEDWGSAKGMLPQYVGTSMGDRLNPGYWKYAAALTFMRQFMGWEDGQHVTEDFFDRAVRGQQEDLRFG
jgi:hypothetical protein